ncbi:MAG: NapC/NirT family cytochrome c [Desulfobacterales bacterium]
MLILVGIIIAFPLFSLGYYTMVRTSTTQFCATCHEIEFAYTTWKTSTHVNNEQGFVAEFCSYKTLPKGSLRINFYNCSWVLGSEAQDLKIVFR